MKIAIFSESYTPYISGVVRSVELLKKDLENLGHQVFLFVPMYPGYKDLEKNVFRLPSIPTKYPGFRIAIPYHKFIPEIDFDIIHSNSPFGLGFLSMKFAQKRGIPYVYTFHTLFSEYMHYVPLPKKLSHAIFSRFIKNFCNKCDCIIASNETTSEYIKNLHIKTRIEIIPSGVDCSLSSRASGLGIKEQLKISKYSETLIYVGRLSKEKNIPFLYTALEKVLKKIPTACLLLVAGGPYERHLKKLVSKMGIADSVFFAGPIKYPDVLNYYKCGDVFVSSSKTETQGIVIAEAKSCGLPVVAVDAGGVRASVINGEDGFLVKENVQEFSEKVFLLLENSRLRDQFSACASKNALRDFSSVSVAKKVEKVYNSLKYNG